MLIDITLGGGNGVGSVGRGRDDLAQRLGTDISRREDTGNTGYPILSGDDISPLVQIRQPLDLTGIRDNSHRDEDSLHRQAGSLVFLLII